MRVVVLALLSVASSAAGREADVEVESTVGSHDDLLAASLGTAEPSTPGPSPVQPQASVLPEGQKDVSVGTGDSAPCQTSESPGPTAQQDLLTTLLPLFQSVSDPGLEANETEPYNSTEGSGLEDLRMMEEEGLGVWPIVGISLAVILIALLIGAVTLVLYRHSLWNRPQTLSDKCSNDESTGYIDDSAFRENSEELYSLDNDSFLNSLEAMTIQNYWTDHVKHTKL